MTNTVSTKERVVWFNGKLVPESEAKLSIYDSALMFGDMVFEMTRSFNKVQFKLEEHLKRLYASIKYLHIPFAVDIKEMEKYIYETIEVNESLFKEDDEHRIMIDVSRGTLSIYENIKNIHKGTNIIIADFPLRWTTTGMGKLFDTGINAVITSQRAIPAYLLEPKVKNRSRVHYLMANIEASKHKGKNNWALLLDPDGFIAEGTGDNFFIVKDNVIITPEPRNILRGISRDYIFDLAKPLGIKCIEKNIGVYDVVNADEAFMTGTPFCMLPVTSINSIKIGDGRDKVFKELIEEWSFWVSVDIEKQIKDWDKDNKDSDGITPYSFKKERY